MFRSQWTLRLAGFVVVAAGLSVSGQVGYQAVQQAPVPNTYQQGSSPEYYAGNLGIWYRLVPYSTGGGYNPNPGGYNPNYPPVGQGMGYQQAPNQPQGPYPQAPYPPQGPTTYGARLSRYPVAGSPCAYLQLEPGDMIVSLDNLPFYSQNDVLGHYGQTSMIFVNVRTSQAQPANLNLP